MFVPTPNWNTRSLLVPFLLPPSLWIVLGCSALAGTFHACSSLILTSIDSLHLLLWAGYYAAGNLSVTARMYSKHRWLWSCSLSLSVGTWPWLTFWWPPRIPDDEMDHGSLGWCQKTEGTEYLLGMWHSWCHHWREHLNWNWSAIPVKPADGGIKKISCPLAALSVIQGNVGS